MGVGAGMGRWGPRTLFGKQLLAFAATVVVPVVVYGTVNLWFSHEAQRAALADAQRRTAQLAAERIGQFVREIEAQLAWATHVSLDSGTVEAHRLDALRVLRQSPAIIDLALVDAQGRERVAVSRVNLDRTDSGIDRSMERSVVEARPGAPFYGPVTFRRETEPFMTLAVAGVRREAGVAIAEVNLKFIRDAVSRIQVGRGGSAWVVDPRGRLVAHPDISLVLSNVDLSARVREIVARADAAAARGTLAGDVEGLQGGRVLATYATVAPTGWTVVVELPRAEADEPVLQALWRTAWIAAGSLVLAAGLAVVLANRVVRPIRALTLGAERLGRGELGHRIDVRTGDEVEALGAQFNTMAGEIEASYAQLEAKVVERTRELALANEAKTRFLAAASHDLRQPLHALSLLVGQAEHERDPARRDRIAANVARAVADINAMFDGLLDISRLDAGTVEPTLAEVPLAPLLQRVHARFVDDARAKGLRLRLAPTHAWARTDPQMLERIVQNLVGNAVRYTRAGGVVLGVRWGADAVRIEVADTGVGIPEDARRHVFAEFWRVDRDRSLRAEGLGLGLAIVERLCTLLDHPIALRSRPGRGTRFTVAVPRVAPGREAAAPDPVATLGDRLRGRRVLVVDDDELVLESTAGLLRGWGCDAIVAASAAGAVERLGGVAPDLLISDVQLAGGETAADVVEALRAAVPGAWPTILVTGDVSRATRDEAARLGLPVLDKPIRPMALRALATRLVAASPISAPAADRAA